jgi:hypothetical protein
VWVHSKNSAQTGHLHRQVPGCRWQVLAGTHPFSEPRWITSICWSLSSPALFIKIVDLYYCLLRSSQTLMVIDLVEPTQIGDQNLLVIELGEPHQGGKVPAAGAATCVQSYQKWKAALAPGTRCQVTAHHHTTGTYWWVQGTCQWVPSAISRALNKSSSSWLDRPVHWFPAGISHHQLGSNWTGPTNWLEWSLVKLCLSNCQWNTAGWAPLEQICFNF